MHLKVEHSKVNQCISPYQNMKEGNPFVSTDIGENCLNLMSTHDLKKQTTLKKTFSI